MLRTKPHDLQENTEKKETPQTTKTTQEKITVMFGAGFMLEAI